jgi:tRNA pseudouridine55 synthase
MMNGTVKNMKKNGLVILHKPAGITSHTAVQTVRRLYGVDKAGHTGTLDPLATGVLPVMIGRGVKASEYLVESDKHYIAVMTLGLTTDTEDITGKVLSRSDDIPSYDRVLRAIGNFVGELDQIPPMYSAIRVGGKRLMELARKGETVERTPRRITVYRIDAIPLSEREYSLDVVCSKGTYIRTLCADIGAALGCGAVMSALCRAQACGFKLSDAHTLEELSQMSEDERDAAVIGLDTVFAAYPSYLPEAFFLRLLKNGLAVKIRKLRGLAARTLGERVRLTDENGFFALGEIVTDEEGDLALRQVKQF